MPDTGKDRASRANVLVNRLAGDCRLVDRRPAFEHRSIDRDAFSGTDEDSCPGAKSLESTRSSIPSRHLTASRAPGASTHAEILAC